MTLNEFYNNLTSGKKLRAKSWDKNEYICLKDGEFLNENGEEIILHTIDLEEFEIYINIKDPKNWVGKLCWFWGNVEARKHLGVLTSYFEHPDQFEMNHEIIYEHCCLATREEIEQYIAIKDN